MRKIGDILVAILLNLHLIDSMRPRIEVNLATLCIERKVRDFDHAARMEANFRHPCYQTRIAYPRIEVLHFVKIFVSAHTFFKVINNIYILNISKNVK